MKLFEGNIVDVLNRKIFSGVVCVRDKKIEKIIPNDVKYDNFIIPGFVDSHIHIESSMLPPSEFARIAVKYGTVSAVCDAHEIANVLGVDGVEFMLENAKNSPFKFYFSAPSCVPATKFETSGGKISGEDIEKMFQNFPQIKFLGEMMNFPGVLNDDAEVLEKINIAKKYNKKIDGHAPGMRGEDLKKYVSAGISTDHECFSREEALEKLSLGMKVQIREGSAVKNFDDLISVADEHFENCMFCSDDKHPDDLLAGHINELVSRSVKKGIDAMKVLRMACINPVLHYGLEIGLLQIDDFADFLVVKDLENFEILKTVINGEVVFEKGKEFLIKNQAVCLNNFEIDLKTVLDFFVLANGEKTDGIEVFDGQLITKRISVEPKIENGGFVSDAEKDVLKIVVVNRYKNAKSAIAFIKNFGLKKGAIASSVAHDSHNIIAVGISDQDICSAVNLIIKNKGGVCAVCEADGIAEILLLPIAGLMSNNSYEFTARKYAGIDALAKKFGSLLKAPFMTLSFMALLVIPEIKLSDLGLFDGVGFGFIKK